MSQLSSHTAGVGPVPLSAQVEDLLVALGALAPSSSAGNDGRQLVSRTTRKLHKEGGGLRNEWPDVHHTLNE